MPIKEILIRWLNDAYIMETGIVEVLEEHLKDAEGFTEVEQKIQQHLEETKNHQEMVRTEIERLGGEIANTKSAIADILGSMQGKMTMGNDLILKNAILEYATEHKEIAVYKSILITADKAGETEIQGTIEKILDDEESMAKWLEDNLETTVHHCINVLETTD